MRGARRPGPTDHVLQMQRYTFRVRDGDVQHPLYAVRGLLDERFHVVLVEVVIYGEEIGVISVKHRFIVFQ